MTKPSRIPGTLSINVGEDSVTSPNEQYNVPAEDKPIPTPTRLQRARDVYLARWPDLFNPKAPVPLAVGIHRQLRESAPEVCNRDRNLFLGRWVRHRAYRAALGEPEALRYNLDGSVHGPVSEKDRNRSRGETPITPLCRDLVYINSAQMKDGVSPTQPQPGQACQTQNTKEDDHGPPMQTLYPPDAGGD